MYLPVERFVSLRDFAPRDPEFFKRLGAATQTKGREDKSREEVTLATRLHGELIFLAKKKRLRLTGDAVDVLLMLDKELRPMVLIDYLSALMDREVIFPASRLSQVLRVLREVMKTS